MTCYTVRTGIKIQDVELHTEFYHFSIEYTLCTINLPKSMTDLELEKQLASYYLS